LLLAYAQGAQRSLVAPPRLRFQETLPVRDRVLGANLTPFIGLACLALGVIAVPLVGDMAKTFAAKTSAQVGQALLSQPLAIVIPKLSVIPRMALPERLRGRVPGGQGCRALALEDLVERPGAAGPGVAGMCRLRWTILCRGLERAGGISQRLYGQPAVHVGRLHMQPRVAAMPDHQSGPARLDLQIVAGRHAVQLRPALATIPCGKQRCGSLLPYPSSEGLPAMLRLEVGCRPACLALSPIGALPRIDGV